MRRNKKLSARRSKQTKLEVDAIVEAMCGQLNDVRVVDALQRRLRVVRNEVAQRQINAFPPGTAVTFVSEDGCPHVGTVVSFDEALREHRFGRAACSYYAHDIWPRVSTGGKLKTKVVVFDHGDNVHHAVEVSELYDASTAAALQYV